MNALELTVTGNHLDVENSVSSTSGSVNYDKCVFSFDEEWNGFEKTAVFGLGRDSYRVALDEDDSCFIPSPCMEKEGIITVGVFGTNADTVIATNSVAHHIKEGICDLGEWFEEDYSLVLNAVSRMEDKVEGCLSELKENFDALIKKVRRSGTIVENETADCPDEWYCPPEVTEGETFAEVEQSSLIEDYYEATFDRLWENFPNYIRCEKIGTDTSGTRNIYAYSFEPLNYEKTVLVTAGVHGEENAVFFALYNFFNELCRNSENDRTLAYLKNRVKFVVVPAVNPYGVASKNTTNENDVDIGYNFPYRWSQCTKSKKGALAGDQIETQCIMEFADILQTDKLCAAIDFHMNYFTVSGKGIFYPRYADNCLKALTDFVNRFNFEIESGEKTTGILAPSINPSLVNYLVDSYGINGCEAIWPEELYGEPLSNENLTKFTEFIGNLLYTVSKNSSYTCKCGAAPFVKYISWHGGDDSFPVPNSLLPTVMGISSYYLSLSEPCILSAQGYVILNLTSACTVKIVPVLCQDCSPEQSLTDRKNSSDFAVEIPLKVGTHAIPVSTVLQAYYTNNNHNGRTLYNGKVMLALAVSASSDSCASVEAFSLTLTGMVSDMGRAVEISRPMGEAADYDYNDEPTQQLVYPIGRYTYEDGRFNY